jgi:hypothetical protein
VKQFCSDILVPAVLAGLILMPGSAASAQMAGRRKGMNAIPQSMHSMMQRMDGMMMQMQGMMGAHQGMMGNSRMSGISGSGQPAEDFPAMMQSMQSMGESIRQTMGRMDSFMSDRKMMAKPDIRSNMEAMRTQRVAMMGSMQGMVNDLQRIQKDKQTQ